MSPRSIDGGMDGGPVVPETTAAIGKEEESSQYYSSIDDDVVSTTTTEGTAEEIVSLEDEEKATQNQQHQHEQQQQLPTTCELSKILQGLCGNLDNTTEENENDDDDHHPNSNNLSFLTIQLATIRQLRDWAQVANANANAQLYSYATQFYHDLNELGGLVLILEFLERHIQNPTAVATTMKFLKTIFQGSSLTEDSEDTGSMAESRTASLETKRDLARKAAHDLEGVELLFLRAFEIHGMVEPQKGGASSSSSSSRLHNTNSLWSSLRKLLCDDKADNDFRTRSTIGQVELDYISISIGDLDICGVDDVEKEKEVARFQDDPTEPLRIEYSREEAGVAAVETLSLLFPFMNATQASNMIKFLSLSTSKLLKWKSNCQLSKDDENNMANLLVGIVSCLITATSSQGDLKVPCRFTAKKVVGIATSIMKAFPFHGKVNESCCVLLRQNLPRLQEQDWYDTEAIVILDKLHSNMNMTLVDAKRMATTILTDLCEK